MLNDNISAIFCDFIKEAVIDDTYGNGSTLRDNCADAGYDIEGLSANVDENGKVKVYINTDKVLTVEVKVEDYDESCQL